MKTAGLSPPFFILIWLLHRHREELATKLQINFALKRRSNPCLHLRRRARPYFFFAPTRLMLLIASGVRPDFSAISRSCSMI